MCYEHTLSGMINNEPSKAILFKVNNLLPVAKVTVLQLIREFWGNMQKSYSQLFEVTLPVYSKLHLGIPLEGN